jgi:L-malate glycosyltransferase
LTKILYLLNYVGKGGTEKYVLDLIRSAGPENCVLIYSEEGPGLEDFLQLNLKIFQVNMSGPFDFAAAKKIKKIIQSEKITIVHTQFLRENYLAILAKMLGARCRVIWTYHVDVPMGAAIRTLNKFMTSFNDKVITVSKFMYRQLQMKGVSSSKLKLIYNGVDGPNKAYPITRLSERPVISVVGRLREEKGQVFLLKSLAHFKKQYPEFNWVCHIYGEGPQKNELVSLVKELNLENFVHFKGFCAEKERLYLKSDIVVVPSSNEALSYVAIEAMSYSRVVIATNVGGLPEVVINGETGLLIPYGNTQEMVDALEKLFRDTELVQKLSIGGRKHFEVQFTMKKMLEETFALYNI